MRKIKILIPVLAAFCFFSSCKKDSEVKPATPNTAPVPTTSVTPTVSNETGSATFDFKALANNTPLIANTSWYTNANGDSFTVSKFNYYISNVRLKKADGTSFSEPESYHLNKHPGIAENFSITQIPAGNYTSIEFLIGVDSTRNVSGAQVGALDVKEDMFWSWNSGYIFFKLEGSYKTQTVTDATPYGMHVGGFSGRNSCIVKCKINFSTPLIVKKGAKPSVYFYSVIDEVFKNPTTLGLETYSFIGSTKVGQIVAANYVNMFQIYKIEN